jgi:outer membrane protein OmpA-like peptidoglycan-associated protein
MRGIFTLGVLLSTTLLVTGCATKNWVQELMTKKQAQIDDRFVTVETRMTDETRRVDGRLGTVETSVTAVGDTARQAQERADSAQARADSAQTRADAAHERADAAYTRVGDVDGRLTRLWAGRNKRNVVDTLHVQFAFNRADLNDGAQTALLAVVKELKENPQLSVDLEGFADSSGPHDYNVTLSQRRVEAVRRYLIQNGAELSRINWVGLGPLAPTERADEKAKQRRVTVKLMINPD